MSRIALVVLVSLFSQLSFSQETFPSRAVAMIVPFPPGGVADIVGRPLAAMMEKSLKQPVVRSLGWPSHGSCSGRTLRA